MQHLINNVIKTESSFTLRMRWNWISRNPCQPFLYYFYLHLICHQCRFSRFFDPIPQSSLGGWTDLPDAFLFLGAWNCWAAAFWRGRTQFTFGRPPCLVQARNWRAKRSHDKMLVHCLWGEWNRVALTNPRPQDYKIYAQRTSNGPVPGVLGNFPEKDFFSKWNKTLKCNI